MGFLNPLYLLAALAAAVPLVIHLLHRQKVRVEMFPSLEFLRRMMRKKTRRFHLKQLLLLITRILIMLMIALALAGPTLTGGRAVRGHLPTAAAVVIDDSYSMQRRSGGQTLFDMARSRVAELLEMFDGDDEVYLLASSAPPRDISQGEGTDPSGLGKGWPS
jgi:hypothetical protein